MAKLTQDTEYITTGDRLIPLRRQLVDRDGRPIDLSSDTITFSMAGAISGTAKVSAQACTVKQAGDGYSRITAITAADPPVITSASHGLSTGDVVRINGDDMLGMDELKGNQYQVTVSDTSNFSLDGVNALQMLAYTSGGLVETRGFVQYSWAAGDVDTAGTYYGQFKRTNSTSEHIPIAKALRIEIIDPVV